MNNGNISVMQKRIETFRCPSDVAPDPNSERNRKIRGTGGSGTEYALATSNYVGCNSSGQLRNNDGNPDRNANGIFMRNNKFRFKDITDGTAFTIAVGERAAMIRQRHRHGKGFVLIVISLEGFVVTTRLYVGRGDSHHEAEVSFR